MNKLLFVTVFLLLAAARMSAQMPPPGYDRAKKAEAERMKMLSIDRDSLTLIDTAIIFDPTTYEEETRIIEHRISIRDYCTTVLGMAKPEILMDGQPHLIIDPRTYKEVTIRLTPDSKLDIVPKEE